MKHKVCSAMRKLQMIPVPGVSAAQFVKYMKAETRLPLAMVKRMVLLALQTGVEHKILTVDQQGFYRLQPMAVPKTKMNQGVTRERGASRNRGVERRKRDVTGRSRAGVKSRQGQRTGARRRQRGNRRYATRGKGRVSRTRRQRRILSTRRD